MVPCRIQGICDYGGKPDTVRDCSDCPVYIDWERKQMEEELREEYNEIEDRC